jgi:CRISPR/Cas system CSM-associated protein Csm4 (group 5 of RAMP superfamily)
MSIKEFRQRHTDEKWKQIYGKLNKDSAEDILTALVYHYMLIYGKDEDDAIKSVRADAQRMKQD